MALKAIQRPAGLPLHFQKWGHHLGFNRLDHLYPKLWNRATWSHEGETYTWQSCRCRTSSPVCLEGRVLSQKGLFLRLNISQSLPCQVLDLLGTHHTFLLSNFSLFGMGLSILCLSHHCILKVPVQFHRSTAGEEFCVRINHTLCLTHI